MAGGILLKEQKQNKKQKNVYMRSYKHFAFSWSSRATEVFFNENGLFYSKERCQMQKFNYKED